MFDSVKAKQIVWLLAAAALLTVAARLHMPLSRQSDELTATGEGKFVTEKDPGIAVLTTAPGGLRAILVNYLWIRSQSLKDEGKFYDAMQRAALICKLQPNFPSVWSFHSWNMAWNISVACHTPEERWRWVNRGIELLRDEAIPNNPDALLLYKDLAWIFSSKMGGYTDEMHGAYKQRWAADMQRLLGAPPLGATDEALEAFRPITEAPLDRGGVSYVTREYPVALIVLPALVFLPVLLVYGLWEHKSILLLAGIFYLLAAGGLVAWMVFANPMIRTETRLATVRQGEQSIQADQREVLLRAAAVREYADKLRALGLRLDEDVLDVYNRFSRDEAVEVIRARAPVIQSDRDRQLSALINDARYADVRRKLLAFLRAQVLWNRYKMDPAWMFELMKKYGPLDWRLVQPQALYWSTYGIHISRSESLGDIDAANTDRIVLNSLKDLTFYGRLVYTENVEAPDWPILGFLSDPRFIEATNREHERLGMLTSKARHEKFEQNLFRAGHINYLVTAIQMLYAQHDYAEARKYLDYIREKYNPEGPEWQVDDLRQFVVERLDKEGRPIYQVAVSQITSAMTAGWMGYVRGQPNVYRDSMGYVQLVYDVYEKEAVKRLKLPPIQSLQTGYVAEFLTRPQLFGLWLPLTDRGKLYRSLAADSMLRADMGADVQLRIYDFIAPPLRAQCRSLGLEFETMFPEPPGLSEYRKQRARALPGGQQSDRP